jgi:hypothetical protein
MRFSPHDYQKYAIDYIESHPSPRFSSTWDSGRR